MNKVNEKFNVFQFYSNGQYEKIGENKNAKEAVTIASYYTTSNITKRIIITDDRDFINFEWIRGIGVTFPSKEQIVNLIIDLYKEDQITYQEAFDRILHLEVSKEDIKKLLK